MATDCSGCCSSSIGRDPRGAGPTSRITWGCGAHWSEDRGGGGRWRGVSVGDRAWAEPSRGTEKLHGVTLPEPMRSSRIAQYAVMNIYN